VDVVEALVGYAHCLAETLAADRTDVERVGRVVGADHLEAALESHRGAIVVTAHTGAWDFAAHLLTTCGAGNGRQVPVVMVMAPEVHPEAAAVQDAQRRRLGLEVRRIGHPIDSLPLVRHLREGGVVAIQLDRAGTSGRVRSVPFCGSRIDLPDGPLHLAAMTGAPIVPVFTWRRGFFDYLLELFPPVYLPRRPRPEQFDEAARSVAESMERFFRRHPTHWFDFSAALPLEDT
jgi:KDO2-lipid IV(A) lauroyltransferase